MTLPNGHAATFWWVIAGGTALFGGVGAPQLRAPHPVPPSPTVAATMDTSPVVRPVASTPWSSAAGGWAGRVVVEEHTTALLCEPCQYLDAAVNGLSQRYPATVVIPLIYHKAIDWSMSDPVDGGWSALAHWYGYNYGKCNEPKPACFAPGQIPAEPDSLIADGLINGRPVLHFYGDMTGSSAAAPLFYARLAAASDAELRRPPEAFFHVQTTVHGGQLRVRVSVDSLTGRHPAVYLRLLLVEDTVFLRTPHRKFLQREQHMVVRAYAHTKTLAMGLPLPGPGTQQYTFDVAAIQRRLAGLHRGDTTLIRQAIEADYEGLGEANAANFKDYRDELVNDLPNAQDWRVNPKRLHVVAFVQDAHSGEVLQAALVPVDGGRLVVP